MKYKQYFLVISAITMIFSCNNGFDSSESKNSNERSVVSWNNSRLILLKGLDEEDLYKSDDDFFTKLIESEVSRSTGAFDYSAYSGYAPKDFSSAIDSISSKNLLPNFSAVTEKEITNNISIITKDFPDLSEEQIYSDYENIMNIYHNQIKSLVVAELLENRPTSRSVSDVYDGIYFEAGSEVLTYYEVKACTAHPLSAGTLYNAKTHTQALTKSLYTHTSDNRGDAFRHMTWNIIMAKYGVGMRDEKIKWASDFSTAHEKGTKHRDVTTAMDLHNNPIGRAYYKNNTNIKYLRIKAFGKTLYKIAIGVSSEPTDSEIKRDIFALANRGTYVTGYIKDSMTSAEVSNIESRIANVNSSTAVFINNIY